MRRFLREGLNLKNILIFSLALMTATEFFAEDVLSQNQNKSSDTIQRKFKITYPKIKRGRLAFTYKEQGQKDIYVLNLKTQRIFPIATDPLLDESSPSWSPDGQSLAFQVSQKGEEKYQIAKSDYNGQNLDFITKDEHSNENPHWAISGGKIAFSSNRNNNSSIFITNSEGTLIQELDIKRKKQKSLISRPRFSPRNDNLLFASNEYWPGKDIAMLSLKTAKLTILTTGYKDFSSPSWHPNGGSFIASHGSSEDLDIWKFEKGTKFPQRLIQRPGIDKDGIWTDDAREVFFCGEINPGKKDFQLFMWHNKEQEILQISNAKGSISQLSWTPFPTLDEIAKEAR